jgi:hypothetical protein
MRHPTHRRHNPMAHATRHAAMPYDTLPPAQAWKHLVAGAYQQYTQCNLMEMLWYLVELEDAARRRRSR